MQICPQCGEHYDDGETVCSKDGAELVKLRPSQAMRVDPLLGRRIKDTFLIQSRLGAGGMGTVYKAVQERLNRLVALKILPQHLAESEEAVLRFHREARSASALSHPNTIVIYDYGQEPDGLLFLAMEFVDGRGLTSRIREGNLTPRRIFAILEQVVGSLMEAHGKGMIHRDLKPDNIMLTNRGGSDDFVKVLDFGLAKAVHEEGERATTITQGGMVLGTPAYMSPEQIQNLPLTVASDQYALGVITFEMITGQLPFQGATSLSICMQHVSNEPPALRELYPDLPDNPQLEGVIRRCLAKDPGERFANVAEYLEEIRPYLQGEEWRSGSAILQALPVNTQSSTTPRVERRDLHAGPHPVREPAPAPRRLLPLVLGLVLAVLLIGGGATAFFLLRKPPAPAPAAASGTAAAGSATPSDKEQQQQQERQQKFEEAMAAGKRLFQEERYPAALEQFEAAHGYDMSNPVPYQWMGDTHKRRGSTTLARLSFEKYLALSEGDLAPSVLEARLATLLGTPPAEAKPEPTRSAKKGSGKGTRPPSQGTATSKQGTKPQIDTAFE
ncbi:MAG: serine/threonine-protein kinase [Myxococcota bacterium]|jgi:serine/threonine protein kinase|nr:serine/threonine-protein kinase [Myxococcota bacterium]